VQKVQSKIPCAYSKGANPRSSFAKSNIKNFLVACRLMGVSSHNLFKPKDLYKRFNDRRVVRCILYFILACTKWEQVPTPSLMHLLGQIGIIKEGRLHYEPGDDDQPGAGSFGGGGAVTVTDELKTLRRRETDDVIKSEALDLKGVGMADSPGAGQVVAGFTPAARRKSKPGTQAYTPSAVDPSAQRRTRLADQAREAETKQVRTVEEDRVETDRVEKDDLFMSPIEQLRKLRAGQDDTEWDRVLQNVDVTSLLVGQGDESDIDNPALASILFPTFKQDDETDEDDPNRKRIKQWVRNSALLVVAVRPSKLATFTTRRPFTTCFGVVAIVFIMFIATFWPYMHSLRLDISIDQFRVEGDPVTINYDMKSLVNDDNYHTNPPEQYKSPSPAVTAGGGDARRRHLLAAYQEQQQPSYHASGYYSSFYHDAEKSVTRRLLEAEAGMGGGEEEGELTFDEMMHPDFDETQLHFDDQHYAPHQPRRLHQSTYKEASYGADDPWHMVAKAYAVSWIEPHLETYMLETPSLHFALAEHVLAANFGSGCVTSLASHIPLA
jgi:hypothetical protein